MASIKCGNCTLYHTSIDQVRECYGLPSREDTLPLGRSITRTPVLASPAQRDYLHALRRQRDVGAVWASLSDEAFNQELLEMSRDRASLLIQEFKECPLSAKTSKNKAQVGEGVYKMDGEIFKVKKAVHGSGSLYASMMTKDGSWTYAPGYITRLRPEHKLTLDEAKEYGRLYGRCCVCGRTLTDERSIADGIGPICAGKDWWA